MLKRKAATTPVTIALLMVSAAAVSAQYQTAFIGVSGGGFAFSEYTRYLHGNVPAPMQGMTAGNRSDGTLSWIQGRADGGNPTRQRGYDTSSAADVTVFCHSRHMVNGLNGWYSSSGVKGLKIQCLNKGSTPYVMYQALGKDQASNYKSIKCSNQDIAWGFYGAEHYENLSLMRIGLLCNAWP